MKIRWKTLAVCLLTPLAAGGLSALCTREGMKRFESLAQPPLTPPQAVFPIVWTALYLAMGYASYRVAKTGIHEKPVRTALVVYGAQLTFNFCWSLLYFRFGLHMFAFAWLCALWLLIAGSAVLFYRIDKKAGALMLVYLAWTTFAGYLNLGVALLNP